MSTVSIVTTRGVCFASATDACRCVDADWPALTVTWPAAFRQRCPGRQCRGRHGLNIAGVCVTNWHCATIGWATIQVIGSNN